MRRETKKREGRTKPNRPANLLLYSLYLTWGGGAAKERLDLSSDAEGSLEPGLAIVMSTEKDGGWLQSV